MCGTETDWYSYMKSERFMVIVQDTCRKPDQIQQLESLESCIGIWSGEKSKQCVLFFICHLQLRKWNASDTSEEVHDLCEEVKEL